MGQTEEQKEGEGILGGGSKLNYTFGTGKQLEEKFSCFWGDVSWK